MSLFPLPIFRMIEFQAIRGSPSPIGMKMTDAKEANIHYRRVILKLSGESLADGGGRGLQHRAAHAGAGPEEPNSPM